MSDRIDDTPIIERPDLAARLPPLLREFGARVYAMGECRILLSREPLDGATSERLAWHLSISCAKRDPTWNEIATARYRLLPEVLEMAMYLPPLEEYVNLHPFTFHLQEVERSCILLP